LIRTTSVPVLVYVPTATLIVSPSAAFPIAPLIVAQDAAGARQELASLPAVATYKVVTARATAGEASIVGVAVSVGVGVSDGVRVSSGVEVSVGEGVSVKDGEGDGEVVSVAVSEGDGVSYGTGVSVGVADSVGAGVPVRAGVSVSSCETRGAIGANCAGSIAEERPEGAA